MRLHGDAAPRARHRVPVRATPPGPAHPSRSRRPRRGSAAEPSTRARFRPEERPLTEQDDTGARCTLAEGFAPATADQWWGLVGAVLRRLRRTRRGARPGHGRGDAEHHHVRRRAHPSALHRRGRGAGRRLPRGRAVRPWPPPHRARQAGLGRPPALSRPGPAATRQAVLADLENGVTSLWLAVGEGGLAAGDLPEVLPDVLLDLAPVGARRGCRHRRRGAALLDLWRDRLADPAAALGNLGLDPLGVPARTGAPADLSALEPLVVAGAAPSTRGVRAMTVDALPYHDAGGVGRPGAGLRPGRRAWPTCGRWTDAGLARRRGLRPARVPLRRHRRPVPHHRQAARRAAAVGAGRRGLRASPRPARAAPARRHLVGDDDPAATRG